MLYWCPLYRILNKEKGTKREKRKKEKYTTNCRQLQELTNIKQHFPKEFPQFLV